MNQDGIRLAELIITAFTPVLLALIAAVGAYFMAKLKTLGTETHEAVNSSRSELEKRMAELEEKYVASVTENATLTQQVTGDAERRTRDDVRKTSDEKLAVEHKAEVAAAKAEKP